LYGAMSLPLIGLVASNRYLRLVKEVVLHIDRSCAAVMIKSITRNLITAAENKWHDIRIRKQLGQAVTALFRDRESFERAWNRSPTEGVNL